MYLTNPNPEFTRLVVRTPAGMMFWAGTCSDPEATCAGCKYYGYTSVLRDSAGNAIETPGHPTSCALYYKHTGKSGKSISPKTSACKYFENKQS